MGVDADYMATLVATWAAPFEGRTLTPLGETAQRMMLRAMRARLNEADSDLALGDDGLLLDSLANLSALAELLAHTRGLDLDAERRRQLGERRSLVSWATHPVKAD